VSRGSYPTRPKHGGDVEQEHIPKAHGLAQVEFGIDRGRCRSRHGSTWIEEGGNPGFGDCTGRGAWAVHLFRYAQVARLRRGAFGSSVRRVMGTTVPWPVPQVLRRSFNVTLRCSLPSVSSHSFASFNICRTPEIVPASPIASAAVSALMLTGGKME